MKAIILAAGAGRRLGAGSPKCMVDVGGASIIHRQLAAFRAAGGDAFVVVVGHRQDEVRSHLAGQPGAFTFIENSRYAETNTIYSLWMAREHFAPAFFYANADVVFDRRLVERLRDHPGENTLAVRIGDCDQEEVKVVAPDGRITRIGKTIEPQDCLGEFIGLARFGGAAVPDFAAELARCVEGEGTVDAYFELALDRLCNRHELSVVDVSDLPCREIDFPEDLEKARRDVVPRLI